MLAINLDIGDVVLENSGDVDLKIVECQMIRVLQVLNGEVDSNGASSIGSTMDGKAGES